MYGRAEDPFTVFHQFQFVTTGIKLFRESWWAAHHRHLVTKNRRPRSLINILDSWSSLNPSSKSCSSPHTLATDSTSRARVWTTSNVDEEGSLAVLAMAGVAGKDVVVDEGGAAAGNDVALLVLALLVLTEE